MSGNQRLEEAARIYGEKILKNKMSNRRISRMCGVSLQDAPKVRKIARQLVLREAEAADVLEAPETNPYIHESPYYHNPHTDSYVFTLPGVPKPIVLPGNLVRDLQRAYSSYDGQASSINECARTFKLPRAWVIKIVRALGLTHDSLPFTPEEMQERDDQSLIEEATQLRAAALYKRLERDKWKEIQRAATKWNSFEVNFLRPIMAAIEERPPLPDVPKLQLHDPDFPYVAVVGLSDLHHGKYSDAGEAGEEYNREITRKRLFQATQSALEKLVVFGAPEKFILPIGSDFLQSDNDSNTTTRGTPQDSDGTPAEMFVTGCQLMEDYVEMLRQVAPVQLVLMSGNHDRMLGLAVFLTLEALYRDANDVQVLKDYTCRQYVSYGSNLIGFVHGDGVKKTGDLAGHMAREVPIDWGACEHKTIYTGHLHYEKVEVDVAFGVTRRQLPSLSGPDRWHHRSGYVGAPKSLPLFIHDRDEGVVGIVYGKFDKY